MKKLLIFIPLLIFSCQKKKSEASDFKTRNHSELAVLMIQLEQNHKQMKSLLEQGKGLDSLVRVNPEQLLSAKPTFESDVDSVFIHYANNYIKTAKQLMKAENQKEAYNQLVDACLRCHENKCSGPIVRIKKLYIK